MAGNLESVAVKKTANAFKGGTERGVGGMAFIDLNPSDEEKLQRQTRTAIIIHYKKKNINPPISPAATRIAAFSPRPRRFITFNLPQGQNLKARLDRIPLLNFPLKVSALDPA